MLLVYSWASLSLGFGHSHLLLLSVGLVFSLCPGFPGCFELGSFLHFAFSLIVVPMFSMESSAPEILLPSLVFCC